MPSLAIAPSAAIPNTHIREQVFPYFEVVSATTAVMLTTQYIQNPISDVRFKITLLGGETLLVEGTRDGTVYSTVIPVDEATGNRVTAAVAAALPSGSYKLPLKTYGQYRRYRFTKSAAVQIGTLGVAIARPYQSTN